MKPKTRIPCTLDIIFRNGCFGRLPVGTLHTPFGSYACRDKWLETLDAGSFQGEFEIASIALSGYMTRGPVREQRTFIKVVVSNYYLENLSDEVADSEYATLDDPILDNEDEIPVETVETTIETVEPVAPVEEIQPNPLFDNKEQQADEMVLFIREQLRTVGNDMQWNKGEALTIPADLGRGEQRKIREYLIDEGYKMTDPINRLWTIAEEVGKEVREVENA